MKNVRVKVTESCLGYSFWFGVYEGRKELMTNTCGNTWRTIEGATRNAKAMAKRIGIKYDPEIIRQHGC